MSRLATSLALCAVGLATFLEPPPLRAASEGGNLTVTSPSSPVGARGLLYKGRSVFLAGSGSFWLLNDPYYYRDDGGTEAPLPEDRFFATARPLETTVADIERGVITHLAALHDLSMETLGAPLAVVVYPRAYQYSMEESPESWERHRYEPMGPWVREPFRYFRENGDRLPYPVLSVLGAFESADRFPLFREDDPHWNEAGARLMAETVAQ